jgi:hypothetical protein
MEIHSVVKGSSVFDTRVCEFQKTCTGTGFSTVKFIAFTCEYRYSFHSIVFLGAVIIIV